MPIGRLLVYNATKGYGFITHGNNAKDVFVHATELIKAGIKLAPNISLANLILEYEIGLGKNNKKQALKIKVVDDPKLGDSLNLKGSDLNQITV